MAIDRRTLARMRELCDALGPEDGVDSKNLKKIQSREDRSKKHDRKTRQLCGQVKRVIEQALANAGSEALWGLVVTKVEPAPDASRLRVWVAALTPMDIGTADGIVAALEAAKAWLRMEVAHGIRRKKAPDLVFVLDLGGEE